MQAHGRPHTLSHTNTNGPLWPTASPLAIPWVPLFDSFSFHYTPHLTSPFHPSVPPSWSEAISVIPGWEVKTWAGCLFFCVVLVLASQWQSRKGSVCARKLWSVGSSHVKRVTRQVHGGCEVKWTKQKWIAAVFLCARHSQVCTFLKMFEKRTFRCSRAAKCSSSDLIWPGISTFKTSNTEMDWMHYLPSGQCFAHKKRWPVAIATAAFFFYLTLLPFCFNLMKRLKSNLNRKMAGECKTKSECAVLQLEHISSRPGQHIAR